ncbi:unnamed protein product [Linum tenue]|uniref:Transmembrane protein n=1 Tax=Linum tenue TaxID=586396 RepID=A0AAV0NPS4_9ROSI|nr:unnamed protein product [Linum tenue]
MSFNEKREKQTSHFLSLFSFSLPNSFFQILISFLLLFFIFFLQQSTKKNCSLTPQIRRRSKSFFSQAAPSFCSFFSRPQNR